MHVRICVCVIEENVPLSVGIVAIDNKWQVGTEREREAGNGRPPAAVVDAAVLDASVSFD